MKKLGNTNTSKLFGNGYFRANALLIGKLVKLDVLPYTSNNIAVLTAVFLTPIKIMNILLPRGSVEMKLKR